ncbi:MAG: hypothetical protein AB1457_19240, partial [Chloroflexota bacterium]
SFPRKFDRAFDVSSGISLTSFQDAESANSDHHFYEFDLFHINLYRVAGYQKQVGWHCKKSASFC